MSYNTKVLADLAQIVKNVSDPRLSRLKDIRVLNNHTLRSWERYANAQAVVIVERWFCMKGSLKATTENI